MISVAMATFNGEKYIAEQLRSICNQSRKVDEIVVMDDCSTDRTVEVIETFVRQYPECNIRVCVNEINLGYKKNFYKALSLCEGDIIFLSDQDDIWKEDKVAVLSDLLETHEGISLISSSFNQIDGHGNVVSENKVLYKKGLSTDKAVSVPIDDVIFHNISQGCAMAFKKDVKELFLKHFTDELPHDWILNIVAAMQKKCYFIKRALFSYRIHDENTTGLNDGIALRKKNTFDFRVFDARQALKVLSMIQKADGMFYHEHIWLEEMKQFATEHVEHLRTKNLTGLLLQNFNPYYKKLKTFRGRLLDIYFVLHK